MPSNNMNIIQLINMMRRSGNPQQFIINILQQTGNNNPILLNLLSLAKKNDTKGIENVARNICQERGVDFDREFSNFKQQLGL